MRKPNHSLAQLLSTACGSSRPGSLDRNSTQLQTTASPTYFQGRGGGPTWPGNLATDLTQSYSTANDCPTVGSSLQLYPTSEWTALSAVWLCCSIFSPAWLQVQTAVLSTWKHSLWSHLTRSNCRPQLAALNNFRLQPVALSCQRIQPVMPFNQRWLWSTATGWT